MPAFGTTSKKRLATVDPDLRRLFNAVVRRIDCSVICGYRGQAEQDLAFNQGKSQLRFPDSKHNKTPARAIDVAPWPIDWNDVERFKWFGMYVLGMADAMGLNVRWGGDWDRNYNPRDNRFNDLVHFELMDD